MRRQLNDRRGFSLIEALGAFAILAIGLAQLLNGVSGGARNEARADFLLRAARQGAAQLDALGVGAPVPFGQTSGRYADGLEWTLTAEPGAPVTGPLGAPIATMFHARLVIGKPGGRGESFALSTVKILPVEPQGVP